MQNSVLFLFKRTIFSWQNLLMSIVIVVLIKIQIKIEYNKIKSTRNYFELCLTAHGLTCQLNGRYSNHLRQ